MTVDESNLKIWTDAGYSVVQEASPSRRQATLYGPNGQKEVVDVGSVRASQLQSQGWGLTPGSYRPPATPTPSPSPSRRQATLYGPNGAKEVVDIGSARASQLQSQGWGLTPGSYRPPSQKETKRLATLFGPGGAKEVVEIGSTRASELQSQGWGLTPGSFKEPEKESREDETPTTLEDIDISAVPEAIRNSEDFQNLTPEEQQAVAALYQGLSAGSEAAKADAAAALEKAKSLADPFYKGLISLAQDELARSQATTKADFESQRKTLQERIKAIDEDLIFGREKLTLDEAAELAALKRNYETQLENTEFQMQEAGLIFSSPSEKAKSRLESSFQETAESTKRRFGAQQRELQVQSERERIKREQQLADLERGKQEALTQSARQAEAKLGSAAVPDPVGGVTGSIEQQRQRAILGLQSSLIDRGDQPLPL